MCLFKDKKHHPHNRPLIAKEDIICYKQIIIGGRNECFTPYTNVVVPVECIKNKVPFKAKILNKFLFFCNHILGFSNEVSDGFIHTYTYPIITHNYSCFECIIPKGTKYFVGENIDYASAEIIFLKRIQ